MEDEWDRYVKILQWVKEEAKMNETIALESDDADGYSLRAYAARYAEMYYKDVCEAMDHSMKTGTPVVWQDVVRACMRDFESLPKWMALVPEDGRFAAKLALAKEHAWYCHEAENLVALRIEELMQ